VEKTNQRIDEWGRVVLDEAGLLELFYKGLAQTPDVLAENTSAVQTYNEWCETFSTPEQMVEVFKPLDIDPEVFHQDRQNEWLLPQEYLDLDIEAYLIGRCTEQNQIDRVLEELELFQKFNLYNALRLFVYIVDTLRSNNVWWGVGRGSSVASYCLFLIGIHRIDSLKYQLDIREFLKEHN